MIRKRVATSVFLLDVVCDKCGRPMRRAGISSTSDVIMYRYVCTCGHECESRVGSDCRMYTTNDSDFELLNEDALVSAGML